MMTTTLIVALVAVMGGLLTAYGVFKRKQNAALKAKRLQISLDAVEEQNKNLRGQIEKQSKTIRALRTENDYLYSKLAVASKAIFETMTGANSLCRLEFSKTGVPGSSVEPDAVNLVYLNDGKYPLKDISIQILDWNLFSAHEKNSIDEFKKRNSYRINLLGPNEVNFTDMTYVRDRKKGVNLNIFFEANNGITTQELRMRFVGGKWIKAERFIKPDGTANGKVVKELIDPDYPTKNPREIFHSFLDAKE